MQKTALFLIIVFICFVRPAASQDLDGAGGFLTTPYIGIGYVTNAPEEMAGGGLLVLHPALKGWGLYLDVKGTLGSPTGKPGYDPTLTSDMVEENYLYDELMTFNVTWRSANAALVRAISADLALYLGAGVSRSSGYREYFDSQHDRGVSGYYWARHLPDDRDKMNLLIGTFSRLHRILLVQFGIETAPRGFTVGATLALPFFH